MDKQFHLVYITAKHKWVLKTDDNDRVIRSSRYKSWALRKSSKYCREHRPCMLVIHTKDGHTEDTNTYHKSK